MFSQPESGVELRNALVVENHWGKQMKHKSIQFQHTTENAKAAAYVPSFFDSFLMYIGGSILID